jgi:hypothetical protein
MDVGRWGQTKHLSSPGFLEKPKFKKKEICEVLMKNIVTDLINALPGNSSVNTVQNATIEEAVFSVDPTYAPIDWLHSDHVVYVCCGAMYVPRLYK